MKLPFDKKYMRIVFHVVVAFVGILIAKEVMELIFAVIKDSKNAISAFGDFIGSILAIFSPLHTHTHTHM